MLKEIGTGGMMQAKYLLEKFDIVADLCDFVLCNDSPRVKTEADQRPHMGGTLSVTPVKFGPLIELTGYLVQMTHTKLMKQNEELIKAN